MAEVAGTSIPKNLVRFLNQLLYLISYSIKRRYNRSTSINAYPGLLVGVEFPNGQLDPKPIT